MGFYDGVYIGEHRWNFCHELSKITFCTKTGFLDFDLPVFPYLQCKLKVNGHIKKHKDIYLNVYSGNKCSGWWSSGVRTALAGSCLFPACSDIPVDTNCRELLFWVSGHVLGKNSWNANSANFLPISPHSIRFSPFSHLGFAPKP